MNSLCATSKFFVLLRRTALDKRIVSSVRHLYSEQYLSVDKYVEARESMRKQYGPMKDNFIIRMKNQTNGPGLVFTEDLKTVIHLCEDIPEDLDVFKEMIKKFHKQNKELRFGTFVFGPVVMRMLYHLRKMDDAVEMLCDGELEGFFDQLKSYLLVMDLLYDNGRYQEILDLYQQLKGKQILETRFPRDIVILVSAACNKINSPESFQFVTELITEARTSGASIMQKALFFAIDLSLKQGKADVALELLSSLRLQNHVVANNLKIIALAELDRHQEALNLLHRKVEQDFPSQSIIRGNILQSALDALQSSLERANDTESSHTFEQLHRSLEETGMISQDTIQKLLDTPIVPRVGDIARIGSPMNRVPGGSYRGRDEGFFDEDRYNKPRNRQQGFSGVMAD